MSIFIELFTSYYWIMRFLYHIWRRNIIHPLSYMCIVKSFLLVCGLCFHFLNSVIHLADFFHSDGIKMNICINETKLSLEIDPHLKSIDFQQWCQGSSMGKINRLFNKWLWDNWIFNWEKLNKTCVLTSHHTLKLIQYRI